MNPAESESAREERFDEIVADYLEAAATGQPPDREELLARHPDLADSLRAFFTDHERMGGLLGADDGPIATDRLHDQPTLPYLPIKPETCPAADQPTLDVQQTVASDGAPSQRLGDYLLLEKIAQGGMGIVYKAQQISLNRIVALKMIRAGDLADDEEVRRFHAEAEAAAQLDHVGIVPIYQVGVDRAQHYFSMAYVEGPSLAQLVREHPLPPKRAALYVKKVAEAVYYAHQRGIIHRDIKPSNVLIDPHDEPKVTDFGLAKRIASDDNLTISGQILGTASYMSPEQASGRLDAVTQRSDVYSLGALLYAVLTQQPPFSGENPLEIILDVLAKEPVPPSKLTRGLPPDLETICLKCLDKDPFRRYDSADMLAEDLERYLAGRPIVARPIGKIERAVRWCRRKPLAATMIALLLLLSVAMPVVYADRSMIGGMLSRNFRQTRDVISDLLGGRTTSDLKSMILAEARRHCANKAAAVVRVPVEDAYYAAGLAMLHYDHQDLGAGAEQQFRDAAKKIELLLAEDPAEQSYQSALADCYVQLARVDRKHDRSTAIRELRRARELLDGLAALDPDNMELRNRAATTDMQLMSLAPAEEKFKIPRDRPGAKPERRHGIIRFRLGRDERSPRTVVKVSSDEPRPSIDELRATVDSNPRDTRARILLADALRERGDCDLAWANYEPAFRLFQILERDEPGQEQHVVFASAYRNAARMLLAGDRVRDNAAADQPSMDADEALRIIQEGIELHLELLRLGDTVERREGLRECYALLSELCAKWPKDRKAAAIRSTIWPSDALAFYDAIFELRTEYIFLF